MGWLFCVIGAVVSLLLYVAADAAAKKGHRTKAVWLYVLAVLL